MAKYTTVIFDLDGTLIDSAPDLHAAINSALADLSRAPLDLSQVVSFIGNGVEKLVERSLVASGRSDPVLHRQTLQRFLAAYDKDKATLTRIYPGVEERLTDLASKGVRLGVCTNKPDRPAQEICRTLGLDGYFEVIRGARDGQPKKPDPAPLLASIAALGGSAGRALYVGDSTVDHATAQNAETDFALFSGGYLNGPITGPAPVFSFDHWSDAWSWPA